MVIEASMVDKFSKKLSETIDANLHDENFSVSDLAAKLGMSRVTLHRKAKQIFKKPVSEIIREARLKKAYELLNQKSGTVSEIAFQVGFSSVSYFNQCFHKHFGFPPGEVLKKAIPKFTKDNDESENVRLRKSYYFLLPYFIGITFIAVGIYFIISNKTKRNSVAPEKSIFFMFPVYNSGDSTFMYQVNGAVEAILNQLSLINDITVYPWSSSMKYRNSQMSGFDIAKEVNANYVVETSGIAYDSIVRINIKLINALTGKQIWYKPYDVDISDLIKLPLEITGNITNEIHALVTPVEQEKINKSPTDNYNAYNYYTMGMEKREKNPDEAIGFFKMALENDNEFALAYAELAITYYSMDEGKNDGKYLDEIKYNADKAILYDPQRDMCLIAKAYDYINKGEHKQAIPFLQKAVEYNPNSAISYRLLANLYNLIREANTEKYLEYKLKAIKLDIAETDSRIESEDYRLAARALRVAGFYNEAEKYIDKSLTLNENNFSAVCEKGDIIIERDKDYGKARTILSDGLRKDPLNVEMLRSVFTNYYLTRDYKNAYIYYKKIMDIDESGNIFVPKDFSRIAVMFDNLVMKAESIQALNRFKNADRSNQNPYVKSMELSRLYSLENDKEKALEQLTIFSQQKYHFRYSIRMLNDDAVFDNIRELGKFKSIYNEIDTKFWNNHQKIKNALEKKGLI